MKRTAKRTSRRKSYDSLVPLSLFFAGTVIGSVLTYFFDPLSGRQRKALVRDKAIHLKNESTWYGNKMLSDIKNRTEGIKAKTRKKFQGEELVDNETLAERVRSKFGRITAHPGSIQVIAEEGIITLLGPILAHEVDDLIKCVSKVDGVDNVVNLLDVHETPDGISGLQGEGPKYLQS